MISPHSYVKRPSFEEQWAANIHWFNVRVDNHVRHTLLKYGAIKPQSLADEIHALKEV